VLQELEKRYYDNNAADAAKADKAAVADLNTLNTFFGQRGWASLTISSSSSDGGKLKQLSEADYRELDGQLDEVRCLPWLAVVAICNCIGLCWPHVE
jgi:hypothetical protein